MAHEIDLSGCSVLVVEDEYFIATDATQVLEQAGARVIGPCRTAQAAQAELARQSPDAALLDVNLGAEPSFDLADTLMQRGIPFVFMTGYDKLVLPPQLSHVERLVKPFPPRRIVEALAGLTRKAKV